MPQVKAGATSVLQEIEIRSAATGQPLPGLTAAQVTAAFRVRGTAGGYSTFALTGVGTLGTWATGWFAEIDATNAPGRYEIGLPNQFAGTGAQGDYVDFALTGGPGMTAAFLHVDVVAYDPQSTKLGIPALPSALSGTIGGLPILGTGAGGINVDGAGNVASNLTKILGTTSAGGAGFVGIDWAHVNAPTTAVNLTNTTVQLSATGGGAMTESYAALHAAPTLYQAVYEIRALLAESTVAGTSVTTKKMDGATSTGITYTIDQNPNPTTMNRTA